MVLLVWEIEVITLWEVIHLWKHVLLHTNIMTNLMFLIAGNQ